MASIKLNYPDMLQQIKLSIFTGDHSAIYSMACAVACIAASFSLITWYNKMLNDPYGRLDMRAVVRTLIVLFLTCNFYSFVLVPFDSITHTVTKAISASVDKDPSGLWGKVNDVYSSVEDKTKEETLVGQFDAEMENARKILDQGAEIDAGFRGEVKEQLGVVKGIFTADQLHRQLMFGDLLLAYVKGVFFTGLVLCLMVDVLLGRYPQYRAERGNDLLFRDVGGPGHGLAHFLAAGGFHDHRISGGRAGFQRIEVIELSGVLKADAYDNGHFLNSSTMVCSSTFSAA